jgi:tetratricopeptide (TPR) repeat protein
MKFKLLKTCVQALHGIAILKRLGLIAENMLIGRFTCENHPGTMEAEPPIQYVSRRSLGTRKSAILLLLLLLSGCIRSIDSQQAEQFQAAQKAFDSAAKPDEFAKAAAMYQELLDPPNNFISGEVYYNLGNAWMRAKKPGRAIAAYRQAERYLPRDTHLEENLREALKADTDAHRPILETIMFWQNWLSYPEKFYLATGAIALTLLLAILLLFASSRMLKRMVLGLAAFSLLTVFSAFYDAWRFDYVTHGVTVEADVVARKGNAESYEPALTGNLPEGTEFRLLGRRSNWLFVRLPGGQEGWIEDKAAVVY